MQASPRMIKNLLANILKEDYSLSYSVPLVPPALDKLNLDQFLSDFSCLPEEYLPAERMLE